MNIMYPDYDSSVLSISSSILAHYGVTPFHKTLPLLDATLAKGYKNVVVMLFDGLGTAILNKHLTERDCLRAHKKSDISSVFPPTTTAATTAIYSGLLPIEHAWLGWSLYFKEIDKNVNIFTNVISGTKDTLAADYNVALKYIPYENIFRKIMNADSSVNAEFIAPFTKHKVNDVPDMCNHISTVCANNRRNYILAYWPQPDHDMHELGTEHEKIHDIILDINRRVADLSARLRDTLIIVTADHGMIDTEYAFITDYPEISDCLIRPYTIESRAVNFFVKPGKTAQFAEAFNNRFGEDFMLLTKEEVLERGLFGRGTPHERISDFLGDYLAVATGRLSIEHARPTYRDIFKGQHAGLTEEEMIVPLIIIEGNG